MLFQVESNIKKIKKVSGTLLEAIDYVKINVINLNNWQEIYDSRLYPLYSLWYKIKRKWI